MPTIQQLVRKGRATLAKKKSQIGCFKIHVHKEEAYVQSIYNYSKKPNSALRKVARVRLSNGKEVNAYIPGEGHNLQSTPIVLFVRGGRVKDLRELDITLFVVLWTLPELNGRTQRRSKYGAKRPKPGQAARSLQKGKKK